MFCSFLFKMIPPYQTPLDNTNGTGVALVSLGTDKIFFIDLPLDIC